MKVAEYPHEKLLKSLKLSDNINSSDLPDSIQKLEMEWVKDYKKTTHKDGKQHPSLLRASENLAEEINDWYDKEHQDNQDDVPQHVCGCKQDKILARCYSDGKNVVTKSELKEKGYKFGMTGPVKDTKNFTLKSRRDGAYDIVKK